jgi:anti-sigma regulatory factor (Ser/Thr protein kinase)
LFSHHPLLYAGQDQYLDGVLPFVHAGLEAGETVLVVVPAARAALVRDHLGAAAEAVRFQEVESLGRNPARLLPAVADAVAGDRPARVVGEPVWAGRRPDEVEECRRHEHLVDHALASATPLRLLCPYDVEVLPPAAVAAIEAAHSEPEVAETFAGRLAEPPAAADRLPFDVDGLGDVRALAARQATAVGLTAERLEDLSLAITELAGNAVRHGGGHGELRAWADDGRVVCEIATGGRMADPLAGRRRPAAGTEGGWGLWLVNQVCDLVQLRSGPAGTVTRIHLARG